MTDAGSKITGLQKQAAQARVLHGMIGETQRLQQEYRKLHRDGSAGADDVLRRLNQNLDVLRRNKVAAHDLAAEYRDIGDAVKSLELRARGLERVEAGREQLRSAAGDAVKFGAAVALPMNVSAGYNAVVRDIGIKAGIAGTSRERDMKERVMQVSRDKGMPRDQAADLLNQLVSAGLDLKDALAYLPDAAAFSVGQGAAGGDTGAMIAALRQNAAITDPREMRRALEAIAYQGQAGAFEAPDMARHLPSLLAMMADRGMRGLPAIQELGSMLQVQRGAAGTSDEAANNLKNWLSKISDEGTRKRYADAGINYQGSMDAAIARGMSTMESSFGLARAYIEAVDPEAAKRMAKGLAEISQETDPERARAMVQALQASMKASDVFTDMQVKAALSAYMQGHGLYQKLKAESAEATGILDKNLEERRSASQQLWREMGDAVSNAMVRIGDAVAPITDLVAKLGTVSANFVGSVVQEFPRATAAIAAAAGGFIALRMAKGALTLGRGVLDLMRAGSASSVLGRIGGVAGPVSPGGGRGRTGGGALGLGGATHVYVTNWPGGMSPPGGGGGAGRAGGRAAGRVGAGLMRSAAPFLLVGAAVQAADVYRNAETRDEKAQGYGSAAGGLGGAVAGMAMGAAVGSAVPIIGTAVGGLIGGVLGGMGGSAAGGGIAKALFGSSPADRAKAQPAPVPVTQEFTFQPHLSIVVQGDVKDPRQLAGEIFPHLRRMLDDFAADVRQRSMFDAPNV